MKLLQIVLISSLTILTVTSFDPDTLEQIIPHFIKLLGKGARFPTASYKIPEYFKNIVTGTLGLRNMKLQGMHNTKITKINVTKMKRSVPKGFTKHNIKIQLNINKLFLTGDYNVNVRLDFTKQPVKLLYRERISDKVDYSASNEDDDVFSNNYLVFGFENLTADISIDVTDNNTKNVSVSDLKFQFKPLLPRLQLRYLETHKYFRYLINEAKNILKPIYFSMKIQQRSECITCITSKIVEFLLNTVIGHTSTKLKIDCACLQLYPLTLKNILENILGDLYPPKPVTAFKEHLYPDYYENYGIHYKSDLSADFDYEKNNYKVCLEL